MPLSKGLKQEIREYLLIRMKSKIAKREELRREIEEQDLPFHRTLLSFLSEEEIKRLLFDGSFVHGLSTSMGTWYEQIALKIARNNFGEQVEKITIEEKIPESALRVIDDIIMDYDIGIKPDYFRESELIKKAIEKAMPNERTRKLGIRVDFYIPDIDGRVFAAELKTPKSNKSVFKGEKRKLLQVRALLIKRFLHKEIDQIHTCFVFSYNPYHDLENFIVKWPFGKKYLDYRYDLMIGKEFWDFIGGFGTYKELLDICRDVGKSIDSSTFN